MYINQDQLASERQCLSRIRVTVAGQPASAHDVLQFQTVTLMRYGLEADLSGSTLSTCLYRRTIHSLKTVDLRIYAKDMKYVKLAYLNWIQGQAQGDVPWLSFKRIVAAGIQYKWILAVVANLFRSPKAVLQWLAFDERLLLNTPLSLAAETQKYIDYEEHLAANPIMESSTTIDIASIIGEWLHDFSFAEQLPDPTFGPGAVAEEKGRNPQLRKLHSLECDWPTVQHLAVHYWNVDPEELVPSTARQGAEAVLWTNRIIFRPKNALTHRIISAEPAWLSWLQQAIKRPLYDYIEDHPYMNTWFKDQRRSREMAQRGSVDGSYATIDFSSASDSISVSLVSLAFAEVPHIRGPLLATRSRYAKLGRRRISLQKFAPMGSATCFVTMDIIILSVAELAIRRTFFRKGRSDDYAVYGDDAVIRVEAAREFIDICCELGLVVNSDKSYFDGSTARFYREACGIEALDGVDITPFRYSRFQEPLLDAHAVDAEWWTSAICLMNRCFVDYYYFNVRSVVWECITQSCTSAGPEKGLACSIRDSVLRIDYSDYVKGYDGPLAVIVPDGTATNFHCRRGYDKTYQRPYIRVRCLRTELEDHHDPSWANELTGSRVFDSERAGYTLWFFKAQTDRPSRADQDLVDLAHNRVDLVAYYRFIDVSGGADGAKQWDHVLLGAAAGIQTQKWGWIRYYL